MTMYDWIKQASYQDLQEFLWWVYHRGNEDGRHCAEDSPPGGLPSYFGSGILNEDIEEVGFFTGKEPSEEDYDWEVESWKKIIHNIEEEHI